jgi:glycosyltransferase involved in cell wall biosynthesis
MISGRSVTTLYVCYFGLREPLVQTQVLPYLRELVRAGIAVRLLTFEPRKWTEDERDFTRSKLLADGIAWHALRYHKRPFWLATAWDIAVGISVTAALAVKHNIDILHARSHVPLVMALGARVVGRRKVIFDLRGLMAEEYADAGIWSERSLPFLAVKAVEKLGLRRADEIVVLTERFRAWLVDAGLVRPERITVIPCCTPVPLAADQPRASARERLEVVYAGSVGGLYLLEQMGRFVLALQTLRPGVFFRVLTQAPAADVSERLMRGGLSPDDFWVGAARPEDVAGHFRRASGGLSFRKGTFSQIAASPTKVAEYLSAGLPVATNTGIGDLDSFLADEGVGLSISDFRWETLLAGARQFDDLLRTPDLADRCRESARRHYDLSGIGGTRYRAVYSRLSDRSRTQPGTPA